MAKLTAAEKEQRQKDTQALLNQMVSIGEQVKKDASAIGNPSKEVINGEIRVNNRSTPEIQKLNLQQKKEERLEVKSPVNAAQIKRDRTKKEYDDYVKSDEYKQRVTANDQRARADAAAQLFLNPGQPMPQPKVIQDEKEMQLRAAMEQAEKEYNDAEDQKVIEQDLEAITGLSAEERRQLEMYAVGRDVDYYESMNMAQNGFQMGRAQQNASDLIAKYGQERVDEMANTISRQNNAQLTQQIAELGQKHGDEHAFLGSVGSVAANTIGGIMGTMDYIKELGRNDQRFKTLDPNAMGNVGNVYAGAVRGQVQQNIEGEDPNFLRKAASLGYQGVMSAADSIARAYLGGGAFGGAALAATNSFSQTMAEASRKGATPAQAALLATTTAGIEALSEKIPLDNLIRTAKGQGFKSVILNALAQAGIEATTEEISLLGTVLAEAAILQEKSSYRRDVMTAIMNGVSVDDAIKQASQNIIDEALNTAMVSMISGGASSLGGSYADARGMPVPPTIQEIVESTQDTANNQQTVNTEPQQAPQQPQTAEIQQPARQPQAVEQEAQRPVQPIQQPVQPVRLFRGFNKSDNPTEKNLTQRQSAYNIIGKEDPNEIRELLPLAYYTENEDDAKSYAEMDKRTLDTYRAQAVYDYREKLMNGRDVGGLTEKEYADKEAINKFRILHGRDPNNGGHVESYLYTPGKTLDLTDLGDTTNSSSAYRVLAQKLGMTEQELDTILTIGNRFEDEDEFYTFNLLRNTPSDNLGSKLVELAKKAGYDSIRYIEEGNSHYAIMTDKEGWESNFSRDSDAVQPAEETSGNSLIDEILNELSGEADMQMGASNQSADGGQIKGTGAAEQNFTGKPAYNATLSEDNAQPDRKNDVRPMELPAKDINDNPISATTANVYGSQNTPDDLAGAMEEPIAKGDFSYVRISNDAATQRAQQSIGEAGSWETARDNFRMDVDRGNAGAELSARGALILNHAAEVYQQAKDSGDVQAAERAKREWLTILSDVQKLGTNTAQGLQALKIIRNLMPKDKIQFTRIAVQNMVRDMRLNTDIQIDDQLLTDYENATTDQQRDKIMEKIQQNVADQIPTTWLDKWNALRYTNMLGNLKTNVRNVAGNVANTFIYRFKDGTGAVIEAIANKATGGKTGRTKSVIVDKRIEKACADYYQQVKNAINDGGKYSENTASGDFSQGVMDKRQIFKFKPLEGYRKATNWMMNNQYFGDEAFGKASFTHAMAGYLQANGVKNAADIQKASPDLIDNAVAYAVKEAQETTFKDNTALANVLGKIKKDAGIVGEGLMPFTKTPANVLVRSEEYSPLGIINTAVKAAQAANPNSDVTGTDVINSLSKTLTGSAVFALGAILKSQGILNGGPDDDEEQAAFDKMNGIQPYSINMPDGTTYTLDWLTPVAMPLFMGAQLMQTASEKDLTFADLEQVFTSIADPMIQMSMMQGINSSLEDIKYSGNNMGQFFINAAVNYLTQGLTNTLLGHIERSTEENRQTTYIDKDSQVPEWAQRALGKASQKIPGWDYQQTDYVDAWGQKQKNEGGLGYNLLSPGYSSKKRSDAVTEELNRLREATGENVFPSSAEKKITYTDKQGTKHVNYSLSDEEYQTLAQKQGQISRELWDDMVKSPDYAAMTDAEKAKVSSEIKTYAKKTGEIAAVGDSHTGYGESWMMDVQKKGANEIVRKTFTSDINGAMSNLGTAWEKKYDEAAFVREMETVFNSFQNASKPMQQQVLDSLDSNAKIYIEARKDGVASDKVLGLQKTIATAKPEAGTKSVGQKQKMDVIANYPGMTNEQRRLLGKLYGTDAQDKNIDEVANIIRAAKADGKKVPEVDTFKLYTQLYRDHEDYTHGTGKRNRTIAHWKQKYGIDHNTAMQLYKAFS